MNDVPGARVIGWAARLVPFSRRRAWRREWEAEVAHAWARLNSGGRPSPLAVMRLRLRILSCVIDALWEMKETMTMMGLLNDVRFALRSLLRYPTFTTIAVLTLALGIGANTAVFTLVDGVLISPLPFERSEELIAVRHLGREGRDALPISAGLYALYRERSATMSAIAMHQAGSANLVWEGEPQRVATRTVTPGFFELLGVTPTTGRAFTDEEGRPDAEPVVLISDGLWRESFGGDPAAVGQSIDVNGTTRRIVGVVPSDFAFPDREARLWLPYPVDPVTAPLAAFGADGIARLSPGSTIEGVDAELEGLIGRLRELFPDAGAPAFLEEVGLRPHVLPLKQELVGDVGSTLWILLGTVAFVLLIACANVANLLLVRAESRQRELALRVAVGAGRLQVLRSFLGESAVLAVAGGLLGTLIAWASVRVVLGMVPTDLPRVAEIGLDLRVMGFTSALTVGCALFFGFFPLLRYGADDLAAQLREGSARGATGGPERHRLRNGLVVVQMALALVLLVGSGLMLRSFQALRAVDPGFDTQGVLTARLSVPQGEIAGAVETASFFRQLGERLEAQGGVERVGFAAVSPLRGGMGFFSIELEDHPRGPEELPVLTYNNQVEAGFLEALGIDLLEGRTFRRGDGVDGERVAVVSESFARQWYPDRSPVGRRLRLGFPDEDWSVIVGMVADAKYQSLEAEPEAIVYWPTTVGAASNPQPTRSMDVVIRTVADPLGYVSVLRREVQAINPRIPISNPETMEDRFRAATARVSFTMSLLGAASAIALVLGLVGIYGVVSYVVSQRTREIGVRMALGASAPSVRGMVVRQGLVLASAGALLGLIAAASLSSVMARLLYGVSATDPLTYGAVSVALLAVAVGASWIPAMRAAGVDPSSALRQD